WIWTRKAGGADIDTVKDITIDSQGNIYSVGTFKLTASFGTETISSNGGLDIFVAGMDTNGEWLWVERAGSSQDDVATCISNDNNGNVYLAGHFYNGITFGTYNLSNNGNLDIFIAKLNPDGEAQWAISAGDDNYSLAEDISLDSDSNVFVTGSFWGTLPLGDITLFCNGVSDIYVAKMSQSPVNIEDVGTETSPTLILSDVWPNPLYKDKTGNINCTTNINNNGILSLYNVRGQLLIQQQVYAGTDQVELNCSGLTSGIYFLHLSCGTNDACAKLVVIDN
ncbi:MAG: T9SS type A sorting domain-containing protein, partial [Candidatus Zophobacter franzmannii]|nr:T9SS type A sorting domain-containing protein [Candidatus Zophobacter franzmannii]